MKKKVSFILKLLLSYQLSSFHLSVKNVHDFIILLFYLEFSKCLQCQTRVLPMCILQIHFASLVFITQGNLYHEKSVNTIGILYIQ